MKVEKRQAQQVSQPNPRGEVKSTEKKKSSVLGFLACMFGWLVFSLFSLVFSFFLGVGGQGWVFTFFKNIFSVLS